MWSQTETEQTKNNRELIRANYIIKAANQRQPTGYESTTNTPPQKTKLRV